MKIGIAAPAALPLLRNYVDRGDELPAGYSFPPISLLVEAMLQRGHQVSLFALDPSTQDPRTFRGDRLTIHVGRYRPRHRARDYFAVERADLLTAMRTDPCDLIHAHWTYEFALAALSSGMPHVITAHDAPLHILHLDPSPYRFIRTIMAFHVARKAQVMTAVSPYLEQHFRSVLRYRGHMRVVPNALPQQLFTLGGSSKGNESGPITFATVLTGWGGRKNGHVALKAFKLLREQLPGSRLLMFGPGHGPGEDGAAWAAANGCREGVDFVGKLPYPDLLSRLSAEADVLVHPALEESFCMAIAEAMALGIPVVGGKNSGAVPNTLADGRAGMLVDVRSADDMARAMVQLGSDPGLRLSLGAYGRQSATSRFHMDSVVSAYEELYQDVLKKVVSG